MKFLRITIVTMLLAISTLAVADDFAFLDIAQEDGTNSFQVSQISKITFETDNMVFHLTDGNEQRLPLAGLQKMFFTEKGIQGIGSLATEAGKISISDGQLRLQLGENEQAFIYNVKGEQVFTTNHSGVFQIDNLRKGIYIVRVGSITKKIMTK